MALEYFDNHGREIKTEVIDGVTRQTIVQHPNGNEYMSERQIMSQKDIQGCMADPRYKTDANFREFVYAKMREAGSQGVNIGNTGGYGVLEKAMSADSANSENILEQHQTISALFGSQLYKTSAAERRRVAEIVRQSDPRFLQELPSYRYDAPVRETGQFAPAPKEEESPK